MLFDPVVLVVCIRCFNILTDKSDTRLPKKIADEVSCFVTLTSSKASIQTWVMADTGFTDDISLECCDVNALQIIPILNSAGAPVVVQYEMADNSIDVNWMYESITISIELEDGDVQTAVLNPVAPPPPSSSAAVAPSGEVGSQRLLGLGALTKLDLNVDCRRHRLCKRKHRK